jgi:hypothetical protein
VELSVPKKFNKRTRQRSGRTRSTTRAGAPNPPQLVVDQVLHHTYRYVATSSGAAAVTWAELCGLYGFVDSVTTYESPVDSVRIGKIEVWAAAPAVATSSTSVSFEWAGVLTNTATHIDLSNETNKGPHVLVVPTPHTIESFWHTNQDATTCFRLIVPEGSVVDVTIDEHLICDVSSNQYVGLGLTVGTWVYGRLDGHGGILQARGSGYVA